MILKRRFKNTIQKLLV